jgi:hypothetical protein
MAPTFSLIHEDTGVLMVGYAVASASQTEIAEANQRLKEASSSWRYIDSQYVQEAQVTVP